MSPEHAVVPVAQLLGLLGPERRLALGVDDQKVVTDTLVLAEPKRH